MNRGSLKTTIDSVFTGTNGEIIQNNTIITNFTDRIELDELTLSTSIPNKKVEIFLYGVVVNKIILDLFHDRNNSFSIIANGSRQSENLTEEKRATVQNVRFKRAPRRTTAGTISLIGEGTSVAYSDV